MKRTSRGFAIYAEFKDEYGKNIRVQASSLATKRCVWIQNEVTEHMGEHFGNAHLNVRMARKVVKALQSFIDEKDLACAVLGLLAERKICLIL